MQGNALGVLANLSVHPGNAVPLMAFCNAIRVAMTHHAHDREVAERATRVLVHLVHGGGGSGSVPNGIPEHRFAIMVAGLLPCVFGVMRTAHAELHNLASEIVGPAASIVRRRSNIMRQPFIDAANCRAGVCLG